VQLFDGLQKDAIYRETIQNMLRLWLELDASVLLSQVRRLFRGGANVCRPACRFLCDMQVEDFFTLPSDFQERIFAANQAAAKAGSGFWLLFR
jgi:hypothetical protein